MVRIHDIKIRAGLFDFDLKGSLEAKLRLSPGALKGFRIAKESIDARQKPVVYKVVSVDVDADLPDSELIKRAKFEGFKAEPTPDESYTPVKCTKAFSKRPVVCGFGPCGMFAALILAEAGLEPIVLERGAAMDVRVKDVEEYWNGGKLNPSSNVQFGEGGAGTFSDGKLTTGKKDPAQIYVLETFADAGADPSILYKQKPHIGTDVLRHVVVTIRKKIQFLGGEIRFNSQLTDIIVNDGRVCGVVVNGEERIDTDTVILGLGHSARDSFEMLYSRKLLIEQKPFSMGVRIEHKQADIDIAQYGRLHEYLGIGAAEYKLNCRVGDNRGVYTFCMCPGGQVVDSSSEEGAIVTNGMSYSARDGEYANSGLLCDVRTSDFGSDHPLAGMYFQEKYEKKAYEAGKGRVPKEKLAVFESDASVVKNCLPDFVYDSLLEALPILDRKLKGFNDPNSDIYGIESRSSSPIRIKRNARGEALASDGSVIKGLYPAGEGAGYAGGIMSAATDGIHMAEMAMTEDQFPPFQAERVNS